MKLDKQAYVDQVCARFHDRQHIPFDAARATENGSEIGRCHDNVDRWVAEHAGDRALRGWITWHAVINGVRLTAHSVVMGSDDRPFDITPLSDEGLRAWLTFVPHVGDDVSFARMREVMNSFDCLTGEGTSIPLLGLE